MSWSLFKLLCHWVCQGNDSAPAQLSAVALDYDSLLELAREQQVEAALAQRLDIPDGLPALPELHRTSLQAAAMETSRRNLQITAQALKLARCLNRVGIVPMFLKGTAGLLREGGMRTGFRQQLDVDLIVPANELENAATALMEDGYGFCTGQDPISGKPLLAEGGYSRRARNEAHHHLLPMVKPGYACTVELHRHFLPRRYQNANPLGLLLARGRKLERHDSSFLVPDTEHELIHMIIGRFVHDGYAARYDFPIRSGLDFITALSASSHEPDWDFIAYRCGGTLNLFRELVSELGGYPERSAAGRSRETAAWLRRIERRYNAPGWARLLDGQARLRHLASSLRYTPAKLPGYLGRMASTRT